MSNKKYVKKLKEELEEKKYAWQNASHSERRDLEREIQEIEDAIKNFS